MEARLFLDKIMYFNESNNKEALNYLAQCEGAVQNRKQQINKVDEVEAINEVDQYQNEDYDGTDCKGLEELSFPFSEYSEEEDQAYYDDN